jgi:hypothetical protein
MKKTLINNLVCAILFLAGLLTIDFISVKFDMGQTPQSGGVFWCIFLSLYFAASVAANRQLFENLENIYLRLLAIVALSCFVTLIFGFIALVIFVNFHLAIGGKI